MTADHSPERERRVRRSTALMAAVALVFYFGYIAMKLYRHYH